MTISNGKNIFLKNLQSKNLQSKRMTVILWFLFSFHSSYHSLQSHASSIAQFYLPQRCPLLETKPFRKKQDNVSLFSHAVFRAVVSERVVNKKRKERVNGVASKIRRSHGFSKVKHSRRTFYYTFKLRNTRPNQFPSEPIFTKLPKLVWSCVPCRVLSRLALRIARKLPQSRRQPAPVI